MVCNVITTYPKQCWVQPLQNRVIGGGGGEHLGEGGVMTRTGKLPRRHEAGVKLGLSH
jgi:hypothetical protein